MTTDDPSRPAPVTTGPGDPNAAPVVAAEGRFWLIPLLIGVVTVIAGLAAAVWPGETVLVAAVIFGVQLIIAGGLRLLRGLLLPGPPTTARILDVVIGVLFVAVGVLCLRHITHTIAVLALLLGLVWLVGGLLELVGALLEGPVTRRDGGLVITLLSAALAVLSGIAVLAYPGISLPALTVLLGVSLVLYGITTVVQAFRLRAL